MDAKVEFFKDGKKQTEILVAELQRMTTKEYIEFFHLQCLQGRTFEIPPELLK